MSSSMKARFQTLLLRINTKITDVYHVEADSSSTCTITPTLAHYTPPDTDSEPLEDPRPSSPNPSRLTFLAIWDPESQKYTLPFIPQETPGGNRSEGNALEHPGSELNLHSRFSTTTTSTSNYVEVSEPQTPQAFLNVNDNPPASRRPEISRSCLLFPTHPREDRPSVCLASTFTHRLNTSCTNLLLHSCFPGYSRKTSSASSPPLCPSSPSLSPLGFLKCKATQSREDEDAWVNIDVECVIRERVIHI